MNQKFFSEKNKERKDFPYRKETALKKFYKNVFQNYFFYPINNYIFADTPN